MTPKAFDCVEIVEEAQAEIQDKLAVMSREEQLAHWHTQTEKLRERQRQAGNKRLALSGENHAGGSVAGVRG